VGKVYRTGEWQDLDRKSTLVVIGVGADDLNPNDCQCKRPYKGIFEIPFRQFNILQHVKTISNILFLVMISSCIKIA